MASPLVYLDNNATTRTDPRVVEAMLPFFTESYGNAASRTHRLGLAAAEAVQTARERIAGLIGAQPAEIVFTSGATESDNLALKGVAQLHRQRGDHVVTQATEHKAILDTVKQLDQEGFRITVLPVDRKGCVQAEQVANALTDRTILVSIMAANNEIGTLQPVRAIGRLCKERGVLFHTDAAQAAGKIPLDVEALGVDLLSLSAHKMYGPKGVGALYVRRRNPRVRLDPLIQGGGHEGGLRSGTLPVPLVVGFGVACDLCRQEMPLESERLRSLAERLHDGIASRVEEVYLNGPPTDRLPGNVNLSFAYVHSDALMMSMPGVAVSSGSACTSASVEPSYVLRALGIADELAQGSVRFGVGRFTTAAEVDSVIETVTASVGRLRRMSPLYEMARQGVDVAV